MISADIEPAYIISHDDENVRLLILGRSRPRNWRPQNHQQCCPKTHSSDLLHEFPPILSCFSRQKSLSGLHGSTGDQQPATCSQATQLSRLTVAGDFCEYASGKWSGTCS